MVVTFTGQKESDATPVGMKRSEAIDLRPPRRVYVVWTEKKTRQIANIGRLEVGADRRADFRFKTPHRALLHALPR